MFKLRRLCGWALLVSSVVCSNQAHAQENDGRRGQGTHPTIALDFDYVGAFSPDLLDSGGGGALRIGVERDLILVTLIPELSLGYHHFGGVGNNDAQVYNAMLG